MCFAIPYKVLRVSKKTALIEGKKNVRISKDLKVEKGDYLQVIGDIAISTLPKNEGLKIRKLIKKLNN